MTLAGTFSLTPTLEVCSANVLCPFIGGSVDIPVIAYLGVGIDKSGDSL